MFFGEGTLLSRKNYYQDISKIHNKAVVHIDNINIQEEPLDKFPTFQHFMEHKW